MSKKLLHILLILFGSVTLVSGVLWLYDTSQPINEYEQSITEERIAETQALPNNETVATQKTNTTIVKKKSIPAITQNASETISPPDITIQTLPPETSLIEEFESKVTLSINGKNLIVPYRDKMTAEQVMKEAQARYPTSFWYERIEYGGDLGTFVQSINGIPQNPKEKMYWILYLNEKKSNRGISSLILNQNDTITWNYEKEIL